MTDLRTAAQQALEALESAVEYDYHGTPLTETHAGFNDAINALLSALAEPGQEPVAWRYKKEGGGWFVSDNEPQYVEQWNDIEEIQPLYTSPPQRKPRHVSYVCPQCHWSLDERKPLTEEEMKKLLIESAGMTIQLNDIDLRLARAIERAHGIT